MIKNNTVDAIDSTITGATKDLLDSIDGLIHAIGCDAIHNILFSVTSFLCCDLINWLPKGCVSLYIINYNCRWWMILWFYVFSIFIFYSKVVLDRSIPNGKGILRSSRVIVYFIYFSQLKV